MLPPLVGSWDIEELDAPAKWFDLAHANLHASIILCDGMIQGSFVRSFSHAQVVLGLCHHSVELFLKGAIHQATKKAPSASHNLFDLITQYERAFPDIAFVNPFGLEQLPPGLDETTIKKEVGNSADQKFRYHLNKDAESWKGIYAFRPESFLIELQACAKQYDELIPRLQAQAS